MRTALVIALCVTGCFSDRGVAIEIDVRGTDATSVELYIGKTPCDSQDPHCNTITPPKAVCALGDRSWFRDDAQRYTSPVQGGKATFRLEAGTVTKLPIVIAVGSKRGDQGQDILVGTATLYDLAVPVDTGRIATAKLVDAHPVVATQTDLKNLNQDRVQVWTNKKMPPGACVVVEHWRPGVDPKRDSVVPEDDPECNDGMTAVSVAPSSYCVVAPTATVGCTLGIRTCNMDGTIGTACAPLSNQVCIPDEFCQCVGSTCSLPSPPMDSGPRIDCKIPIDLSGTLCGGESARVTLDRSCGSQPLLAALPFGGFGQSQTFGGVTIQLSTASEPCTFTVSSHGSRAQAGNDYGMVRLATETSALLLPIRFEFKSNVSCIGQSMTCAPPGDTSKLWTCAR